jgi:hypothetical protein
MYINIKIGGRNHQNLLYLIIFRTDLNGPENKGIDIT